MKFEQAESILKASSANADDVETYLVGCDDSDDYFSKIADEAELLADFAQFCGEIPKLAFATRKVWVVVNTDGPVHDLPFETEQDARDYRESETSLANEVRDIQTALWMEENGEYMLWKFGREWVDSFAPFLRQRRYYSNAAGYPVDATGARLKGSLIDGQWNYEVLTRTGGK
jgi:hypothetical protein